MQKQALTLVFSNVRFVLLSVGISSALFLLLSYMSEFVFFQPQFLLYIPRDAIPNFFLIIAVSALSGIVTSLSTYRILRFGESIKKSGVGFFGTIIGAGAGACGCSSIGFAAASAAGSIGGTATSFLTQYEIPLRLVSIAILGYTYYIAIRGISKKCSLRPTNDGQDTKN